MTITCFFYYQGVAHALLLAGLTTAIDQPVRYHGRVLDIIVANSARRVYYSFVSFREKSRELVSVREGSLSVIDELVELEPLGGLGEQVRKAEIRREVRSMSFLLLMCFSIARMVSVTYYYDIYMIEGLDRFSFQALAWAFIGSTLALLALRDYKRFIWRSLGLRGCYILSLGVSIVLDLFQLYLSKTVFYLSMIVLIRLLYDFTYSLNTLTLNTRFDIRRLWEIRKWFDLAYPVSVSATITLQLLLPRR